jgi:hypothetical protein
VSEVISFLIGAEESPFRDPDILLSPYSSCHEHIIDLAIVSLVLSRASVDEIIKEFADALFSPMRVWANREDVGRFASELAAALPYHFGYKYFIMLLDHPCFPTTLETARMFLLFTRINLFHMICRTAREIINFMPHRLSLFVEAMMANFIRLQGSSAIAADTMIVWIQNLEGAVPRSLQQTVVDALGLMFLHLRLHDEANRILAASAASDIPEDVRAMIVAVFDTSGR